MGIATVFTLLTRPAAMFAAVAGFIALSFAFIAARRAHRRRVARRAAEKRCRKLVGLMRKCPRLRKPEDRRLAEKFCAELDAIVKTGGFALHEVGTSRSELDKILRLVREDAPEDTTAKWFPGAPPFPPPERPGTPIALPAGFPAPAPVLSESVFAEEDFLAPDDGSEITIEVVFEPAIEAGWPVAIETAACNDPLRALRAVADGELDDLVEGRFAAIVNED